MEAIISEWLGLALRWAHIITGIAWIGSSFFFMWLDSHLTRPATPRGRVEGELWMTHSGGFYLVEKMQVTPGEMPKTLHWFKWEAAFTWITGFALLAVVYYFGARVYLIDPAAADIGAGAAVAIGIGVLALAWVVYDLLWASPLATRNPALATAVSCILLVGLAFGLGEVFSGRGAYIHVGAALGTIMVANVWMRIIPAQRKLVEATQTGTEPDARYAESAKQRSVHNNYMTLPVIFIMIAGHYPATFGHAFGWLILLGLFVVGAAVRHWFNLRNAGRASLWPLPAAAAGFLLIAALATGLPPAPDDESAFEAGSVSFAEAQAVIAARCTNCHAARPRHESFDKPPEGVVFDTPEQIKRRAARILARAVVTKTMPLANEGEMTQEERDLLGRWIYDGARIEPPEAAK